MKNFKIIPVIAVVLLLIIGYLLTMSRAPAILLLAISLAARTVTRSAAPGPAPTKCTVIREPTGTCARKSTRT